MIKTFSKLFVLLILAAIFVSFVSVVKVEAQTNNQGGMKDYTLLAPIPCVGGDCKTLAEKVTMGPYVSGFFKLAIGLSAVAAVAMIVAGGFQYMSSDAISGKQAGKDRVWNAVISLVLVFAAWLILNEINPNLLNINLNVEPATVTAPTGADGTLVAGGKELAGYSMTPAQMVSHAETKDKLWNDSCTVALVDSACPAGKGMITTNTTDPCIKGGISGCTNLNDMPPIAISELEQIQKGCGCFIIISGGTEGGHVSHGPNIPAMDLRPSTALDGWVLTNAQPGPKTSYGPSSTMTINGRVITFVREKAGGDHWHVKF